MGKNNNTKNSNSIIATITQINPNIVLLKTDLGDIIWPTSKLPTSFRETQSVILQITHKTTNNKNTDESRRRNLTKLIR